MGFRSKVVDLIELTMTEGVLLRRISLKNSNDICSFCDRICENYICREDA